MLDELKRNGFVLIEQFLSPPNCDALVARLPEAQSRRGRVRHLLTNPHVSAFASSDCVANLVTAILGPAAVAIRATLFDKSEAANWKVPWHQDRPVPLRERLREPTYGPWTRKQGIWHADAPQHVLEQMLAVRIHLDACDASNGPLRVIPASHRLGKLTDSQVLSVVQSSQALQIAASKGSALVMRPLLLHASSPAKVAAHRRVLHLEFAASSQVAGWYFSLPVATAA